MAFVLSASVCPLLAGVGAPFVFFAQRCLIATFCPAADLQQSWSRCRATAENRNELASVQRLPMTVAEFDTFFKEDVTANLALVEAANIPRQ
jgi:hypothetical protein